MKITVRPLHIRNRTIVWYGVSDGYNIEQSRSIRRAKMKLKKGGVSRG